MPPMGESLSSVIAKRLVAGSLPNSPSSSPSQWIAENVRSIESAIIGSECFGSDVLHHDLLPRFIYPRLLVFVVSCVTALGLGATDRLLVPAIQQKQMEWAKMPLPIQLSKHREIQNFLWDTLVRCDDHTIITRQTGERIAKSDALCIAAHVLVLLGNQERVKTFRKSHDLYLRNIIDLLQLLADSPDAVACRDVLLRILRGLARGSVLYPTSLNLHGVEKNTERFLGHGSFGEVWGGTVGTVVVAIKVMRHANEETVERFTKAFIKEALTWKQLSHPHVLPFYGISRQLWVQDAQTISLISPLMHHGNILQYTSQHESSISERLSLLADAASGLGYLHTLKPPVIHGDLKGTNILVTHGGRACLADFGLSTLVEDPDFIYTPTTITATPGAWPYRSPELLEEPKKDGPRKSIAGDIYAFGCVCHELCVANTARFSHLSLFQRYTGVMENWRIPQPTSMSTKLWSMVESCWEVEPDARPHIGEVVKIIKGELAGTHFSEMQQNQWDLTIMTYLREPVLISPLLDRPVLEPPTEPMVITERDVVIALMGPTGTGKSSFVNIALQQAAAEVSNSIVSCTQEVRAFACSHPDRSGRRIILVDTPGFDDTYKSDWTILKTISDWLAKTYRQKIKLSGILQFHAIDERKMRGTPQRNLAMFEDLCGKDAMQNVVLISTHWDRTPPDVASQRETQLMEQFWSQMREKGSRVERFSPRTYDRAWEIIDLFSCVETKRKALVVQKEMVDEGKELHETSAFRSLKRFWDSFVRKLGMPPRKNKRENKREKKSRGG